MKSQDMEAIGPYLTERRWRRPALEALGNFALTLAVLVVMHLRSRYSAIPWGIVIPLAIAMAVGRFAITGVDVRLPLTQRARLHRAGVWAVRVTVLLTAIQLMRAFVPR